MRALSRLRVNMYTKNSTVAIHNFHQFEHLNETNQLTLEQKYKLENMGKVSVGNHRAMSGREFASPE